jgi:hypothetical protein
MNPLLTNICCKKWLPSLQAAQHTSLNMDHYVGFEVVLDYPNISPCHKQMAALCPSVTIDRRKYCISV